MRPVVPAHKVIGDIGKPGQIINPINTDIMDDMGQYAEPKTPAVTAASYKPAHGGYHTPAPYSTDAKRVSGLGLVV